MPAGHHLRLARTKSAGTDDADPRTTPPDGTTGQEIFVLNSQTADGQITQGFRAKIHCDAGDTMTVEVFVRNQTATDTVETWALAGTLTLVEPDVLFVQDDIGDAAVYFRLTSLTSGAEPVEVWAEEMG